MANVEEFLTENTHQNYKHSREQNHEVWATNSFERPTPKSSGFQNDRPLGYHDNISILGVKTDHQAHIENCFEIVNI